MRAPSILFLALLLPACSTPTVWKRPDTSVVDEEADRRQCLRLAGHQAESGYLWDQNTSGATLDQENRSQFAEQQQAQLDFQFHRQDLADACMEARGYHLEPTRSSN